MRIKRYFRRAEHKDLSVLCNLRVRYNCYYISYVNAEVLSSLPATLDFLVYPLFRPPDTQRRRINEYVAKFKPEPRIRSPG